MLPYIEGVNMSDNTALFSKVLEKIPNKYLAVTVAARRARAINNGSRPLVRNSTAKPATLALEEIAAGCVTIAVEVEEGTQPLPTPDADTDAKT